MFYFSIQYILHFCCDGYNITTSGLPVGYKILCSAEIMFARYSTWYPQGCGSGFAPKKPDPGLCPQKKRFLKEWIFFWEFKKPTFLFSYVWCQMFLWCPRFQKPSWIRIRLKSIRIRGSRAYRGRLTPNIWKRRLLKVETI